MAEPIEPDPIQAGLEAWAREGDRERGGTALDALSAEWRPRIRRFLHAPSPQEVEDVLSDALLALCVAQDGGCRALAPAGAGSPAAWRRKVLKNFLIDRSRRRGRRRHAEQAQRHGWSTEVEAEEWRRSKDERAGRAEPAALTTREPPAASPPRGGDDPGPELAVQRHEVVALLPRLAVRRRVLVLLALGGDPSPFAAELAAELSEPEERCLGRIARALVAPHDGGHEHLSLAMIRVVYPSEPEPKARESARKALARAIADLGAMLQEATPCT